MTRHYLGIDIGGTNSEFAYVNLDGKIMARGSVPTRSFSTPESLVEAIADGATSAACQAGIEPTPTAVGIGAPCANPVTGRIEGATDLPWPSPIDLVDIFQKKFGVPACLTNDANAAAAGEMKFGAAKGIQNFIMLTLGTGVGAGVACDGNILQGRNGFAAELGHVTLGEGFSRPCSCGRNGCLQCYASARGVVTTAADLLAKSDSPSPLRSIPAEALTPKDVFLAAEKGDEIALRTFALTGDVIGMALANFAAFSDPEAVVLFGGVARAFKFMESNIRQAMEKNILFLYKDSIRLMTSSLPGAEAAILGAAAMAMVKYPEQSS